MAFQSSPCRRRLSRKHRVTGMGSAAASAAVRRAPRRTLHQEDKPSGRAPRAGMPTARTPLAAPEAGALPDSKFANSRTIRDMRQLVSPGRMPGTTAVGTPAATCSPPASPHEQSSTRRSRIALPAVHGPRRDCQSPLQRTLLRSPFVLPP